MRKTILGLLSAAFVLVSCSTVSPYSTEPSQIYISIVEGTPTASFVIANFETDSDRNYYYANVTTKEEFSQATNRQRFMQLCLDREYMEYINWRYNLLVDNSEYVADFSSHSLYYGDDSRYFKMLTPDTEYVLYAFCVNPETNQPIGDLYHVPFTTTVLKKSDMTFQAIFKEREDGTYVSMIPSNDYEYYVWNWEDKEYFQEKGLTVEEYAQMALTQMKEHGMEEYMYIKGADTYKCAAEDLESGHSYIMFAAGYDGEYTTDIFSAEFDYPFTSEDPIPLH